MAQFLTPAFLQASDASANPLVGAKEFIYQTGTTTLLSLFTNELLTTPQANPMIADSAGVFPICFIAETKFKVVLKSAADVILYTRDPVYSTGQADNVSAENVTFDGSGIGFSSTNVQDAIVELYGSVAKTSGADFLGSVTITKNATDTFLTITSTDAGAAAGPNMEFMRDSASPAASDFLSQVFLSGRNTSGTKIQYASITGQIVDPTAASEDALVYIATYIAGALGARVIVGAGLYAATATGGDKGAGTVNATEFYKNGSRLLFQQAFESAQQTITLSGSLTLAHGLGAQPKLYAVFLQCTTANVGYTIGDEVIMNPGGGTAGSGISVVPDGTNINVRFPGGIDIINKGTGAGATITPSSWRLVARAWA